MLRRCTRFVSTEWLGCLCGIKFHAHASRVLYSSFNKDLPNPSLPTPLSKAINTETDILLEQLKKAKTAERVLELASMHLDVMNAKHIVMCVECINDTIKQENVYNKELMENPIFQGVCSRLMKVLRFLGPQDLITVYKSLSYLGVRNNTYVMQAVLKMIGTHMNDMSLGQLTFLNFLLGKQSHNALVDGLRLALPLVLQVQIEQQLDSDNITEVVDCLQLACRSKLKPATIQKILTTVLQKAKLLSPTNATTVIFALFYLDTPLDGYKELINYSFDILSKNIELMDAKQIIAVLRLISVPKFYHSRFSFAVADKVATEKWNLETTWDVVKMFNRLEFSLPNLMDHFVNTICSESDAFRTDSVYCPLWCVEFLTASGYRPVRVEDALTILCSCETKLRVLEEKFPFLLVKFFTCLAMLGYFSKALSRILDEDLLFSMWSKCRKLGRGLDFERSMFTLAWSIEIYDQQQDFSVPHAVMKNLMHNVCERYTQQPCPVQKFIENGLGGSQFLKSKMFTNTGVLVDHVVAMRSGNYPVNLETHTSDQAFVFIEDIVLPADAKIISVIVAYEDKYLNDPEVLKGWTDLKVKYLAKKNFNPVVISYCNWKNLPDREKIPYLMQAIKSAITVDNISSTNSYL